MNNGPRAIHNECVRNARYAGALHQLLRRATSIDCDGVAHAVALFLDEVWQARVILDGNTYH